MKSLFASFSFIFVSAALLAQSSMIKSEKELTTLFNEIRDLETFDEKVEASTHFLEKFKKTLEQKDAFKFKFDSLKILNGIKDITSPDEKIRIFTWGLKNNYEDNYQYFGLIVRKDGSKNSVFQLKDNLDGSNSRIQGVIDISKWYGSLYIDIIPKAVGSKKYYTLIGWDGNSGVSNIRIIDALYFSGKTAKLGAPIFKNQKEKLNRVYFEYAESAVMNMTYESKYKRIMFDHLIPETPDLKGIYSFYIPDFSYDSYVSKKDGWHLMEDVIGVNNEDPKNITLYKGSNKGGLKKHKVKSKWLNPDDETNPVNDFQHVARTPESEMQVEVPEKVKRQKKVKKSKQNDPLLPQSIYGKKKKRKSKKRY